MGLFNTRHEKIDASYTVWKTLKFMKANNSFNMDT